MFQVGDIVRRHHENFPERYMTIIKVFAPGEYPNTVEAEGPVMVTKEWGAYFSKNFVLVKRAKCFGAWAKKFK